MHIVGRYYDDHWCKDDNEKKKISIFIYEKKTHFSEEIQLLLWEIFLLLS